MIYEPWQPICNNYINDICNLYNYCIKEEDDEYGTNIGENLKYNSNFFDYVRKLHNFDTCTISSIEPNRDQIIAGCFMNPEPLKAWPNNPEWFYDEERPCYLSSFGISKDFRNQGIGTEFLNWLIDEYSKKGFSSMILRSDDKNNIANKLYQKSGFYSKLSYIDPIDKVRKNIMVLKFN